MFVQELLIALQNKGKAMAGTRWELPAGSSLTTSWLRLSCSQIICAARDRPESHPACTAQHRPALAQARFYVDHQLLNLQQSSSQDQ